MQITFLKRKRISDIKNRSCEKKIGRKKYKFLQRSNIKFSLWVD